MNEEMYAVITPEGKTFRCVKSQLEKTGGKCPIWGHDAFPEMRERFDKMKAEKVKRGMV